MGPTTERALHLRYSGAWQKPHRFVVSEAIWAALRRENPGKFLDRPFSAKLFDWAITVSDALPDDYIGVEHA